MKARAISLALGLALAAASASAASASTNILGTISFGGPGTNYYDPANGFVPAGFGNSAGLPVTIGAGTEFGFQDGANRDTADFTGTTLSIQDITFSNANSWIQTFTASTPGFFSGIHLTNDTLPGGVTFSVASDMLTVNWGGTNEPGTGIAAFAFAGAGTVPEPATWALFIVGFGAVGGMMRAARRPVAVKA